MAVAAQRCCARWDSSRLASQAAENSSRIARALSADAELAAAPADELLLLLRAELAELLAELLLLRDAALAAALAELLLLLLLLLRAELAELLLLGAASNRAALETRCSAASRSYPAQCSRADE